VYDVKQAVYEFVSVGARGRGGSSPLHLACARDTSSVGRYPICNFPSVPTIELLLECGAPVDARDNDGNTPLHASACNKPAKAGVIQALLQHGAHFDLVNNDKRTFFNLLKGTPLHEITNSAVHSSLACLAARVVRRHGLDTAGLPATLQSFVTQH
jgi:ankyrin repeat protein